MQERDYDPGFHEIQGHSPSMHPPNWSFCWNIWFYKVVGGFHAKSKDHLQGIVTLCFDCNYCLCSTRHSTITLHTLRTVQFGCALNVDYTMNILSKFNKMYKCLYKLCRFQRRYLPGHETVLCRMWTKEEKRSQFHIQFHLITETITDN